MELGSAASIDPWHGHNNCLGLSAGFRSGIGNSTISHRRAGSSSAKVFVSGFEDTQLLAQA